jgi:nucleotide-binding universal stress UspA family protein
MKILVPVDGSEHALDAVRHALRLHREGLKATFVLATVQEPTYLYEMVLAPDAQVLERVSGAVGARALASALALFDAAGVPCQHEIGSGEPVPALIEMAQRHGCDAIILRSALMGSVSMGILHAASLPVTVVKHTVAGALAP